MDRRMRRSRWEKSRRRNTHLRETHGIGRIKRDRASVRERYPSVLLITYHPEITQSTHITSKILSLSNSVASIWGINHLLRVMSSNSQSNTSFVPKGALDCMTMHALRSLSFIMLSVDIEILKNKEGISAVGPWQCPTSSTVR